jgi:hypothetical protein
MSRDELQRTNQLWRQTSLRIRLQTTDGRTFFERITKLDAQRDGPYYNEDRRTAVLQFIHEPVRSSFEERNYDIEVEVISPAERSSIEARLFTQTSIY